MAGSLFVVATPIGNLEDLTFRALRILREVDLIAAEDTRRTARLLAHYEVSKPLVSYREHNEARETPRLVARLQAGESVALVSDAGTPGISDPGARLVRAAHAAGVPVVPIPGPSAVVAALSASGVAADQFVFLGFAPPTGARRSRWFDALADESRTCVVFESPHRIRRTLAELAKREVKRPIILIREVTKINESLVIWDNYPSLASVPERGEFVIVLGPSEDASTNAAPDQATILAVFDALSTAPALSKDEALELTAAATRTSARAVRRTVKKRDISVKQQNRQSP